MYKNIIWSVFFGALAIYWFQLGNSTTIFLRNTVYLLPPLFATIAAFWSVKVFGTLEGRGKTLSYFANGMLCWFLGEVLFYVYAIILHIDPFPSFADVFYIAAYPFFIIGILHEMRGTDTSFWRLSSSVKFLFLVFSGGIFLHVFYFGVFTAYDPRLTIAANSISLFYGIGDLLLILSSMFLLLLAMEHKGGTLSRVWAFLCISFITMLIADMLYARFTVEYAAESWFYKSLIDSFFMFSYSVFAVGLYTVGQSINQAKKLVKRATRVG